MATTNRKHKRNILKCASYRNANTTAKNAALRAKRHAKRVEFFAAREILNGDEYVPMHKLNRDTRRGFDAYMTHRDRADVAREKRA